MNTRKYKNDVVWRTKVENVKWLTEETLENPATYQATVKPEDLNDVGHIVPTIDTIQCLVDHYGTPYRITAINGLTITVSDDFRTGECPQSGLTGFIYKTAYKGRSNYLPPVMYKFLHPNAAANRDQYNLAILWGNDPNPYRIEFTNSNIPKIENYQEDRLDGYNFAEDYGEDPQIELFTQDSEGVYWERQEKPIRTFVDGLLDSIVFDLSDTYTGYIKISR